MPDRDWYAQAYLRLTSLVEQLELAEELNAEDPDPMDATTLAALRGRLVARRDEYRRRAAGEDPR